MQRNGNKKSEEQLIREMTELHRQITTLRSKEETGKRAEEAFHEQEDFLKNVFESIQDGISVLDADMRIVRVNPTMEKWYSHAMPLIGKKCHEAYHGRTDACDICPSINTLKTGKSAYCSVPKIGSKKEITGWLDLYSFPLRDSATGQLKGVIEYVRDSTERVKAIADYKQAIDALKESEEKYRSFVQNFQGIAFRSKLDFTPIFFHGAVKQITGYDEDEFISGRPKWNQIIYKADRGPFLKAIRKIRKEKDYTGEREYRIVRKDGEIRWVKEFIQNICDESGRPYLVQGALYDVTDRKEAEYELIRLYNELVKSNKKLKRLALMDSHTGLYSHRYLEEAIETELYRARRDAHPLSVIMLDIDYFKSINDVYGHQFGDLILKQFARLIRSMVRRYDTIVRFGGEEFIIVSPGSTSAAALSLGKRILDTISLHKFGNKKHVIKLKVSIAVSSYPENDIVKGMDLIDIADQVLNKVKEYGGNKVYTIADIKNKKQALLNKESEKADVKVLKTKIDRLNKRASQSLVEAIFAFAKTIEVKDHYTGEHGEKTVHYATEIAKNLMLIEDEVERVREAAILHDLGKIGISEKILLKKSALTKQEFEIIKKHPQIGVDIIRPIQFLHSIIPLIFYHHERWDGKGYPMGLKGKEIPIGARIIAIADAFQALSSDRPYRKAYSIREAIRIIEKGSGSHFDPMVVRAFLEVMKRNHKPAK